MRRTGAWLTLAVSGALLGGVFAVENQGDVGYRPSPANLAAREWFQDARFGLFVHWGVYSLRAKGEWVMYRDAIPVA